MRHQQRKKSSSRRLRRYAGALLMSALLLAACSESPKPAPPPPAQAPKPAAPAPAKPEAPKVEEKPAPVYRYNPAGRRDPFMPIIVKKEVQKVNTANRPPLERFNISELKLTGIVWGGFGYNAMIEAPDGKGYFVRIGTVLGPNRGVVRRITQSTVIIEEKYKTFSGEVQRKEIVVELRKKREGTL